MCGYCMGRRKHRHNHKSHRRSKKELPLGIIFAGIFLVLAYFYYSSNNVVGFVILLDYPISSIFYWVGAIVVSVILFNIGKGMR